MADEEVTVTTREEKYWDNVFGANANEHRVQQQCCNPGCTMPVYDGKETCEKHEDWLIWENAEAQREESARIWLEQQIARNKGK